MAVSEYKKRQIYQVGQLKPYVLILPVETTFIDYSIDNGECRVKAIRCANVYKIEGLGATYSSTETLEGRFKFSNTLTVNVPELNGNTHFSEIAQILKGNYYTIFETKNGDFFMESVDYPVEITYSYSFTNNSVSANVCALSFNSYSNIPTMSIAKANVPAVTQTLINSDCKYVVGRVKRLRMCNYKNVLLTQDGNGKFNSISTTGGQSFVDIDFDISSFSFTETYDENVFNQTITFTIPLSEYQYYWHYNLIEFTNNRYVCLIDTMCGNTILTGFDFGLAPTYTIASAEANTGMDTITITLKHRGDCISAQSTDEDIIIGVDETVSLAPVDNITDAQGNPLSTFVCIDETTAVHLILEELTVNGEHTGKYWVLAGYENIFEDYNIVGVYQIGDDIGYPIEYQSPECALIEGCQFIKLPPSIINFTKKDETNTYTISGECEWVITNIPEWLTISPTQGEANQEYEVSFTTNIEPPVEGLSATLSLQSGNRAYTINVTFSQTPPWASPIVFNITAAAQDCTTNLTQYTQFLPYTIQNASDLLTSVKLVSSSIVASVPKNTSTESKRTLTYEIVNGQGEIVNVIINQDKLYQTKVLVEGEYLCDDGSSYEKYQIYEGYYSDRIDIPTSTYVKGNIITANDSRCLTEGTRWDETGGSICEGSVEYAEEAEYKTTDGGKTWVATGNIRPGRFIENNSPTCNPAYQWIDNNTTICISGNLYKQMAKIYTDENGQVTYTGEYKVGEIIEVLSDKCQDFQQGYISFTFNFDKEDGVDYHLCDVWSDVPFQVNYGDREYDQFYEDVLDPNGMEITHRYSDYFPGNYTFTVAIYGQIKKLVIHAPQKITKIKVEQAEQVSELIINPEFTSECTFPELNLSTCRQLTKLEIHNHTGNDGLTSVQMPTDFHLSNLIITNDSSHRTHITVEQLQAILTNLADLTNLGYYGVIQFCPLVNYSGTNLACDVNIYLLNEELLAKHWLYNFECCEIAGAKKYQTIQDGDNFICENFTKYMQMKIQESTFDGTIWGEWVDTGYIFKGDVIEFNSVDCGYVLPVQYRWEMDMNPWDGYYICIGFDSYFAEIRYDSFDGGRTWTISDPVEIRASDMVWKRNDDLCGYTSPDYQYRWVPVEGQYICITDPDLPEDEICLWENAWIDLGFDGYTHTFNGSTAQALPDICNGDEFTTIDGMFENMQLLSIFPSFDTSNVTSAVKAFKNCFNLMNRSGYNLSMYNFGKLSDATSMFENCSKLTNAQLPENNALTNVSSMFKNCSELLTIDFSGAELVTINNFIDGCYKLSSLTGINGSNLSDSTLYNGCVRLMNGNITTLTTLEITGLHDMVFSIMEFINININSVNYLIENAGSGLTLMFSDANWERLYDTKLQNLADEHGVTLNHAYQPLN